MPLSDVFSGDSMARILAGAALGAAAVGLIARSQQQQQQQQQQQRPRVSHSKVHVLLVTFTFASAADRAKWAQWWAPLAATVYRNEPNCLSYEFAYDAEDETKAIIYERYVTKADLDGPHQKTLGAFGASAGDSGVEVVSKELRSFTESNIGHMDR